MFGFANSATAQQTARERLAQKQTQEISGLLRRHVVSPLK